MTDPSQAQIVSYRIDTVYEDGVIETIEVPLDKYQVQFSIGDSAGKFKWEHNDLVEFKKEQERKRREEWASESARRQRELDRYYNSPG